MLAKRVFSFATLDSVPDNGEESGDQSVPGNQIHDPRVAILRQTLGWIVLGLGSAVEPQFSHPRGWFNRIQCIRPQRLKGLWPSAPPRRRPHFIGVTESEEVNALSDLRVQPLVRYLSSLTCTI
jgi:hypothetical protein